MLGRRRVRVVGEQPTGRRQLCPEPNVHGGTPLAGRLVTVADWVVPIACEWRLLPPAVVPTQKLYGEAPVPAFQLKVAEGPVIVLLGAGL